jgi:hypothetical protein
LFTLSGAAAGFPGSSPSHGLNPEVVAGCGEVAPVDAAGGVVESVAPGEAVDDVDDGAVEDVVDEVAEDVLEEVFAGAVEEFVVEEFVVEELVVEELVEEEVVEEESVLAGAAGAGGVPAAAPVVDAESLQNPGFKIEMVTATANRNLYLRVSKILVVEFVFIDCIS